MAEQPRQVSRCGHRAAQCVCARAGLRCGLAASCGACHAACLSRGALATPGRCALARGAAEGSSSGQRRCSRGKGGRSTDKVRRLFESGNRTGPSAAASPLLSAAAALQAAAQSAAVLPLHGVGAGRGFRTERRRRTGLCGSEWDGGPLLLFLLLRASPASASAPARHTGRCAAARACPAAATGRRGVRGKGRVAARGVRRLILEGVAYATARCCRGWQAGAVATAVRSRRMPRPCARQPASAARRRRACRTAHARGRARAWERGKERRDDCGRTTRPGACER